MRGRRNRNFINKFINEYDEYNYRRNINERGSQ
jgi:hypothetical protein